MAEYASHQEPKSHPLTPDFLSFIILIIAAIFRFYALDIKPPHFDEGVNGWFIDQLQQTGTFKYDPENYHGPLHFYVLYVFSIFGGHNLWALRLPVAIVGLLSTFFLLKLDRFFPVSACRWAGLAIAVSPAFTFYNRYAIHESWMVLFMILLTYGIFLACENSWKSAAWLIPLSITGMVLTKETYIIHLICLGLAWLVTILFSKISQDGCSFSEFPRPPTFKIFLKPMLLCLFLLVFFYSGNFFYWQGLHGIYQTFTPWIDTAFGHGDTGTGHIKPFYYWFTLILQYEPYALLSIIPCLILLLPSKRKFRILAIFAVGNLLAFSIIDYKTPWCILPILWPFFILAGLLPILLKNHALILIANLTCFTLIFYSATHSYLLNFYNYDDDSEPYVYVQTTRDYFTVMDPIIAIAQSDPQYYHIKGNLFLTSYYPIPWTLKDFTNIAYYDPEKDLTASDADFLIIQSDAQEKIESQLKLSYYKKTFRLRSGQAACVIYYRQSLFPSRLVQYDSLFTPENTGERQEVF